MANLLNMKGDEYAAVIDKLAHRITVPNLSASALVAQAKKGLNLTYLNSDLAGWNFVTDECGKTYEVLTQKFGRNVSSDDVRVFFHERGFKGNAAAFITWIAQKNPEGYNISIPEDDKLWPNPKSRDLYVPYFGRDGSFRELGLFDVRGVWFGHWFFVAFRELP